MAAQKSSKQPDPNSPLQYPYANAVQRLHKYGFNQKLFLGEHFDAFQVKVQSEQYSREYAKLRWTVANFAGLLSKVSADMLFSEPPRIVLPVLDKDNPYNRNEGDTIDPNANADANADVFTLKIPKPNPNQEWLENLIFDNRLDVQLYESALTNSYKGDAIFKLRIGQLHDPTNSSVIIEQVMPDYYFPDLDPNNVNAEPKSIELSFKTTINEKDYLFKEIHTPGQINYELYLMEGDKIVKREDLSLYDPNLPDAENTGVDRLLVVHIPNWSDGTAHFGHDDYFDLVTLLYALDNRLTKIDHILDKHADPILAIPDGVLDEDGNINRNQLGVFEKGEDGDKPEYIVWDAKLDSSFNEIENIMQSLYMYSETSPGLFGQQPKGAHTTQESGRALKYRLMRTISKIKRKQRYYDYGIKEIVYLAQLLAKAHNVPVNGIHFTGEPEVPSIEWPEPIPQDSYEQAQEEELRLASGNQTLKDSIKNIDGLDDEQAVQKIQEIYAEQKQLNPPVTPPASTAPGNNGQPALAEPQPGGVPNGSKQAKNINVPQTTKAPNANL